MPPGVLRPLLVLLAFLGALAAPEPAVARTEVGGADSWTSSPDDRSDSGPQDGGRALALPGETGSIAGSEEPVRGPRTANRRVERVPSRRRAARPVHPGRRGALAPGERPDALAFLRLNGRVDANGVGT